MTRWLIPLFVVVIIIAAWVRQRSRATAQPRRIDEARRMQVAAQPTERQPAPASSEPTAPTAQAPGADAPDRSGGQFQEAVEVAAGASRGAEAVVAEGVAAAEGDIDAEPLAAEADAIPPGAVPGDGGRECPADYPIKGNQTSMLYHEPGSRSYTVTIPEFCFASTESAEAAGFSAPRR